MLNVKIVNDCCSCGHQIQRVLAWVGCSRPNQGNPFEVAARNQRLSLDSTMPPNGRQQDRASICLLLFFYQAQLDSHLVLTHGTRYPICCCFFKRSNAPLGAALHVPQGFQERLPCTAAAQAPAVAAQLEWRAWRGFAFCLGNNQGATFFLLARGLP